MPGLRKGEIARGHDADSGESQIGTDAVWHVCRWAGRGSRMRGDGIGARFDRAQFGHRIRQT